MLTKHRLRFGKLKTIGPTRGQSCSCQREFQYLWDVEVYGYSTEAEARAQTGRNPVGLKWVDSNKGSAEAPRYRSRLVCTQGQLEAHRTPRMTRCFTSRLSLSPSNLISGKKVVKRKDNASRSSHLHCRIPLRYRTLSTSWLENINPIPFQDTRQSLRVRNTPVF